MLFGTLPVNFLDLFLIFSLISLGNQLTKNRGKPSGINDNANGNNNGNNNHMMGNNNYHPYMNHDSEVFYF